MGILDRIFRRSLPPTPIVQASISIPSHGDPVVTLQPRTVDGDDLALLAVAYGAKVSWLVRTESSVAELFQVLAAELASLTAEDVASDDIIGQMPTGRALRTESRPRNSASAEPEVFKVRLFRRPPTTASTASPLAWVSNELPEPGLVVNIPWSAVLLVAAIWPQLARSQRTRFIAAWRTIHQLSLDDGSIKAGDTNHLRVLFLIVTGSYLADAFDQPLEGSL